MSVATLPGRNEQAINGSDYGLNLGGNLHFSRFHLSLNYQYSLRPFDFQTFEDTRQLLGNQPNGLDRETRLNALRFGIGYLILR